MTASLLTAQELLGLFELDDAGKVLYYRKDLAGEPDGGSSMDIVGHNFYNEVARFENVEEFRRFVTEFTRSATAADSFNFECRYDGSAHRVKVLLARICESVNRNKTKSILVYLKQR
jgi:DNA polymerase II large subunit